MLLRSIRTCLIVLLFTVLIHPVCTAQNPGRRPGVGLVLSGGGALGMAHVGVIKVMEEAGLRPDYITGVSMGSIVGGMYSIGYSADSLYKILLAMDWDALLSNRIPENKIIYTEKKNFYNSSVSLPVSIKKVMLPSGLNNGQMIENSLSFYAWPAADIDNFSKLPIPFMCVGTDLISGQAVDLRRGYLPDAMRASMAVPSIFTPVKIDTALLIDGGFLRNFAASEIKEMGADIVIGSYVGAYRSSETKLQSVTEIIKQLAFTMSIKDFEEEKKLADLVIKPKIEDLLATDFENVDTIVRRGYIAALPYREYFRKLADSLDRIGPQKPARNLPDRQFYSFDKVEINGNKIYSDSQILEVLNIEPGQETDKYLISDRIELLYGKAWFEKVKYRVVPRNDSLILCIDCIERPRAMLYGSLHYDESLGAGIVLKLSAKDLISRGSVIDLESYAGLYFRGRAAIRQYLDHDQEYGIAASFYTDNTLIPLMNIWNEEKGRVISRNIEGSLSISRRIGINSIMDLSFNLDKLYLIADYVSEADLKHISYNYFTATYDYKINTLEKKYFPDRGMVLNLSAGLSKLASATVKTGAGTIEYDRALPGVFAFNSFFTFAGSFRRYFSPSERLTISVIGNAAFITDGSLLERDNNFFLLGGTEPVNARSIPMIGFHTNEIPVKRLAGIGTGLDIEIYRDLHLDIVANAFVVREVQREAGYSLPAGIGIGAGYMSILGPIKAGLMFGQYSRETFFRKLKGYISVGFGF